jgi:MoaA/NifB/PqqE/SkfB family radical SAM enzyme
MSNSSMCLTHARWQSFVPDSAGASCWLDGAAVERVLEELLELPIRTLIMEGAERGCARAVSSIVDRASRGGADVYLITTGHERLDRRFVEAVGEAGVAGVSVPLHGADSVTHDGRRGETGSFALACESIEALRALGVRAAVHTDLCKANSAQLDSMGEAASKWGVDRWVVRVEVSARATMSTREIEQAVERLAELAAESTHDLVTHYAPFFARMVGKDSPRVCATLDERNGICITPRGEVIPDPAIPIVIGQVGAHSIPWLYDSHPLLRALRDPDAVEGKCGLCAYRARCGGSRARALAHTGNLFGSDPACSYEERDARRG